MVLQQHAIPSPARPTLTCSAAAPGGSTSQWTRVTWAGSGISTSSPEAALSTGMSAHSRSRTMAYTHRHNRHDTLTTPVTARELSLFCSPTCLPALPELILHVVSASLLIHRHAHIAQAASSVGCAQYSNAQHGALLRQWSAEDMLSFITRAAATATHPHSPRQTCTGYWQHGEHFQEERRLHMCVPDSHCQPLLADSHCQHETPLNLELHPP